MHGIVETVGPGVIAVGLAGDTIITMEDNVTLVGIKIPDGLVKILGVVGDRMLGIIITFKIPELVGDRIRIMVDKTVALVGHNMLYTIEDKIVDLVGHKMLEMDGLVPVGIRIQVTTMVGQAGITVAMDGDKIMERPLDLGEYRK